MEGRASSNIYRLTHSIDRSVQRNMERQQRREWEAEYVSEYCSQAFKGATVVFHFRLGTWPQPLTAGELTPEEQAMLKVRMRWADAVVIQPDKLVVIEGKLRASEFLKGLGELQLYRHLVAHTPEFEKFKDRTVVGRLLLPIEDPAVALIARQQNLEVAIYQPTFWPQFLTAIQPRQGRSIRPEESKLIGG
jgi:hypothetical protein